MKKNKKSKKSKKQDKKIITLTIILAILVIFLILLIYDYNQKQILNNEIKTIQNLDITKDNIDTTIKTKNIYATIEKIIKNYYQELFQYKKTYQEKSAAAFLNRIDMNYLKENKNNLKDFNLIEVIEENKKQVEKAIENIILILDENNIKNRFQEHKVFSYYKTFYYKKMLTNNNQTIKKEWEQELEIQKQKNEVLKKLIEILLNNQNKWYIENDELYFTSEELTNTYNQYYDEIYK